MNAPARAREFPEGIERRFALRSFIPTDTDKSSREQWERRRHWDAWSFSSCAHATSTTAPCKALVTARASIGRRIYCKQSARKKFYHSNEVRGARNCPAADSSAECLHPVLSCHVASLINDFYHPRLLSEVCSVTCGLRFRLDPISRHVNVC